MTPLRTHIDYYKPHLNISSLWWKTYL